MLKKELRSIDVRLLYYLEYGKIIRIICNIYGLVYMFYKNVIKEDLYLSKQLAGEWGIVHISARYHPLILQALNCYKTNEIIQVDKEFARQFADEMLTMIRIEKELKE